MGVCRMVVWMGCVDHFSPTAFIVNFTLRIGKQVLKFSWKLCNPLSMAAPTRFFLINKEKGKILFFLSC